MKPQEQILIDWAVQEADGAFPGAEAIATTLAKEGYCLTTGHARDIWLGGFGNFLKIRESDKGVDLIDIALDPKVWSSKPFLEEVMLAVRLKRERMEEIRQEEANILQFCDDLEDFILTKRKELLQSTHASTNSSKGS